MQGVVIQNMSYYELKYVYRGWLVSVGGGGGTVPSML